MIFLGLAGEHDLVAAVLLGLVQSAVDVERRAATVGVVGNADPDTDCELGFGGVVLDLASDPLGDLRRPGGWRVWEQHDELVTAVTGDEIAGAYAA